MLFQLARSHGLRVQTVLSFHACGGNVGDSTQIPLPSWVLKVMIVVHAVQSSDDDLATGTQVSMTTLAYAQPATAQPAFTSCGCRQET